MASATPPEETTAAAAPAADVSAPVAPSKAKAAPAPKVDPMPAKAPVAKAIPKPVAKATPKPIVAAAKAAATVIAAAATPPANKRAVKKAAPKIVAATTIKPAVANVRAVTTEGTSIMEATIKNAAEKAKSLFTDANAKSTQAFAEMNDFGKGNIEAIVESGKIAAKGIEAMGQEAADYSRKQVESATAVLKSLSSVKSPTDFFKLQGDYMRSAFDSLVAQTSKNTETMLKLAGEVAQPIQNRVAIAAEKVKIAA